MPKIIPVPAVNAAILNDKGEILLTRRSPRVREPGKWCLPGGHVELQETWETAIRREIQEEVGVEIQTLSLCGIYSDPKITVTQNPVDGEARIQFVVALFLIDAYRGAIQPNDEVDEWGWFTLENLPSPMMISHPIRIQDALSYQGKCYVR